MMSTPDWSARPTIVAVSIVGIRVSPVCLTCLVLTYLYPLSFTKSGSSEMLQTIYKVILTMQKHKFVCALYITN